MTDNSIKYTPMLTEINITSTKTGTSIILTLHNLQLQLQNQHRRRRVKTFSMTSAGNHTMWISMDKGNTTTSSLNSLNSPNNPNSRHNNLNTATQVQTCAFLVSTRRFRDNSARVTDAASLTTVPAANGPMRKQHHHSAVRSHVSQTTCNLCRGSTAKVRAAACKTA